MAEQMGLIMQPLAAMIVSKIRPVEDDMTLYAARRDYGYAWVDDHVRRGNIVFHLKGKRKVTSRTKIELLRASEAQDAKVVSSFVNDTKIVVR